MVRKEGQPVVFRGCRVMERREGRGNYEERKGQVMFIDGCRGESMAYFRIQREFPKRCRMMIHTRATLHRILTNVNYHDATTIKKDLDFDFLWEGH